jgi:gamma-glutamyltranspeptidase / glutathione hydrolase
VNLLDLAANVQAAGDMARFTHDQVSNTVQLESQLFNLVGQALIDMGHQASSAAGEIAGGYQGIMVVADPAGSTRLYRAGSNFREDGDSIGW